ncbi:MAG: glycerophosphoryl diester phosphodiesterase [Roseivirga sp.]|jgi:glycerophosphoryl diester phosphodiesterase
MVLTNMSTHADKSQAKRSQSPANAISQKPGSRESTFQFVNNRPEATRQRKLNGVTNNSHQVSQLRTFQETANNFTEQTQPIQKKENNTGLPDNLKTGMENLSCMSLDDLKVHRNSDKPAQLQAHAYAQGTDIHLGPGQEKHLPHEAWHVVQQKQGRVKPTMQMKGKVNVNDDAGLEKEADVMGIQAQSYTSIPLKQIKSYGLSSILQGKFLSLSERRYFTVDEIYQIVHGQIEYTGDLKKAIKKIAEGPNIRFKTAEELPQIVREKLVLHSTNIEAPKDHANAQWRKVNRIAGLMEAELRGINVGLIPHELGDFLKRFEQSFNILTYVLDPDHGTLKVIADSLVHSILLARSIRKFLEMYGSRFMGQLYNFIGHLDPLAHALVQMSPPNADFTRSRDTIVNELHVIRQLMAVNSHGPSVVAHRGTGPTNRTMGALIREDDQRRTNRPAENSPEAFRTAFESVPQRPQEESKENGAREAAVSIESVLPRPVASLDGVECDVYLSADNIPMLSHEGKVREQLNNARKKLFLRDDRTEVHNMRASDLVQLQRTENAASRFMTLADLLKMSVPVASNYYRTTGRAFRVEVEMKGIKAHGKVDAMRTTVAKVISQFRKSVPSLPVEIILFNGDVDQVQTYSDLRHRKTALGSMYTGLNFNPKKDQLPHPRHVDELRSMLTSVGDVDVTSLLGHFVVTLVFGQELVPHALLPIIGQFSPSRPIDYSGKQGPRDPYSDREMGAELEALKKWHALIAPSKNAAIIKKLHVLTDYPVKAHWLKSADMIAIEIRQLEAHLSQRR